MLENKNYESCESCSYCNYCNSCNSCGSCYYCDSCYYCGSCSYCYYCNYCNYCDSCHYCKNLRMTEFNLFCYSKTYNNNSSFQQKKYRVFNKEVGNERYEEILNKVKNILGTPELKLKDFWKQVTQGQWNQLLSIPEAKDFKEGFEYISGEVINIKEDPMIELPDGRKFSASTIQEALKKYINR